MTNIVTIEELFKLIPYTKILENQSFSNQRELLASLIDVIEKDKTWEFVQYIQSKPSLIIIRRIDKPIRYKSDSNISKKESAEIKIDNVELSDDNVYTEKLFVEKKLPWK